MKLAHKLIAGFSVLIFLMVANVGVTYYQANSLGSMVDDLANHRVQMQMMAQDLSLQTAESAAAIRGYLFTGNEKFIQDYEAARIKSEQALSYIQKNAVDQSLVEPVVTACAKFAPHPERMIKLFQTEGEAAALEYMTTTTAGDNAALIEAANKYADYQKTQLQKEAAEAPVKVLELISSAIILLGIAILISLGVLIFIIRSVKASIGKGLHIAEALAVGDLTVEVEGGSDELGVLAGKLGEATQSLRDLVTSTLAVTEDVKQATEQSSQAVNGVAASAEEIAASTEEVSGGLQEVSAVAEEIAAASENLRNSILSLGEEAVSGSDEAKKIEVRAQGLKSQALTAQTRATELYKKEAHVLERAIAEAAIVKKIGDLTHNIAAIADQTNLLALNAAVEAASAGEHGRGFAVVADEVRKLADEASDTSQQIEQLVGQVMQVTENLSQGASNLLTFINEVVADDYRTLVETGNQYEKDADTVFTLTGNFSATAQQLIEIVQSIATAIDNVTQSIAQGAAGAEEVAAGANDVSLETQKLTEIMTQLEAQANQLTLEVSKFKV